ncbi:MAG: hypothetical protein EPN88_09295 [Bacteroidetes bacterium]|nr:MAG: hypothetical protein EPN88_09295 [Bacteroidota bacterium]
MKIRSIGEFEDIVAKEYSWRRKELTNIRNLSLSSEMDIKKILLKSGIVFLYSHWEGFVKKVAIAYCEYINHQGLRYKQLIPGLCASVLLEKFNFEEKGIRQNYKTVLSLVDRTVLEEKCHINSEEYINTRSNLNSDVLKEITIKIGVDYAPYELKENLIDRKVLAFRNAVAHGDYRPIEEKDSIEIIENFDEITQLIELFRDQVLAAAMQQSYKLR